MSISCSGHRLQRGDKNWVDKMVCSLVAHLLTVLEFEGLCDLWLRAGKCIPSRCRA